MGTVQVGFDMRKLQGCEALRQGKRLQLSYHGWMRVVEVHEVGTDANGHDLMLVWQVRGGSNSNKHSGWKLLRLDDAFEAQMIDEKSEAPRIGYKRGDKTMRVIDCQL